MRNDIARELTMAKQNLVCFYKIVQHIDIDAWKLKKGGSQCDRIHHNSFSISKFPGGALLDSIPSNGRETTP